MISAGVLIIVANVLFSYSGFTNAELFRKYKFQVGDIIYHKEFVRLISSGFLHGDWMHLIFNMYSFYVFNSILESYIGSTTMLIIYFGSLIGGNFLSLFIQRNNNYYSAIGASGAVSGIIFSAIVLYPGIEIYLMFIPIGIPSWLFGILYVLYSMYGMKSANDNIGHEAHLGGAISGMLIAGMLFPEALLNNLQTVAMITVPMVVFLVLLITKPDFFERR